MVAMAATQCAAAGDWGLDGSPRDGEAVAGYSAASVTMRLAIIIEEERDGGFSATCESLPGCVSQGPTRALALANLDDAIEGYLASLAKHGEPVPDAVIDQRASTDARLEAVIEEEDLSYPVAWLVRALAHGHPDSRDGWFNNGSGSDAEQVRDAVDTLREWFLENSA